MYSVSSHKIQWGWASAIWQLVSLFDTVHIVCGAGSIKRSGVRPSVSLSHQSNAAVACGGFAAERRTRKRYRSTAPCARQQQRRSTALSSKQQMRAMSCCLNILRWDGQFCKHAIFRIFCSKIYKSTDFWLIFQVGGRFAIAKQWRRLSQLFIN